MNNIIKYFIPFIFAVFLSLPVQAVTMNGCETTAMQGCSASIFGPTAPFLIDEDFTAATNPPTGWTKNGNSNVVSGELVSITTGGSEDDFITSAFTTSNEKWASVDFSVDSGFVISTNGHTVSVFSIRRGGSSRANVDLINDGGTIKWRTRTRSDAGSDNIVIHNSPVFTVGQEYEIIIRHLRATNSTSIDGGAQIWINNILMRDSLDIDNFDTLLPTESHLGMTNTAPSVAGTSRHDNVKISDTGVAP